MKSLQEFVLETKQSYSFGVAQNPKWDKLTICVDQNNDLGIIFGEPASTTEKDKYANAYELASKIFPAAQMKYIPKTIEEVVKRTRANEPYEFDEERKFCIVYRDAEGYFTINDYNPETGVIALTNR